MVVNVHEGRDNPSKSQSKKLTVFRTLYGNCRKLFTNTSYIYVDKNRCFYTPLHIRRRNCLFLKLLVSSPSICLQTPPISQSKKSGIFIPPFTCIGKKNENYKVNWIDCLNLFTNTSLYFNQSPQGTRYPFGRLA